MKIKRFRAKDMRQALTKVRETFGPDAVIMSDQSVGDGVEVVAAIDFDESVVSSAPQSETLKVAEIIQDDYTDIMEEDFPQSHLAFQDIKTEISGLREMMKLYLKGTTWEDMLRKNPIESSLFHWLLEIGVSKDFAKRIIAKVPSNTTLDNAKSNAMNVFENELLIPQENFLEQGGIVALVGPTGVGKTTTIAKLAARFVLRYGSEHLGLITVDNYRIGAHEQLNTYGKILGIPVYSVQDSESLERRLRQLQDKKLILIDTAGLGQRDARVTQQLLMLQKASPEIQCALVLSSNSQELVIQDIVNLFMHFPIAHCMLTKTDETANLSIALNILIEHGLPLACVTNGQRVPEDLQFPNAHDLVSLAIKIADQYPLPKEGISLTTADIEGVVDGSD